MSGLQRNRKIASGKTLGYMIQIVFLSGFISCLLLQNGLLIKLAFLQIQV